MMSVSTPSILDRRRDQLFPILEPAEIERVRRFGTVRSYRTGEALAKVGEVSPGLVIFLAGHVDVTRRDQSGLRAPIVSYAPAHSWASWRNYRAGRRSWMPRRRGQLRRSSSRRSSCAPC